MNKEFKSNEELFDAIRTLQYKLANSGNTLAANEIAKGFACLNGLTDGWAQLMDSVKKVEEDYGKDFNNIQKEEINDIYLCIKKVVCRE